MEYEKDTFLRKFGFSFNFKDETISKHCPHQFARYFFPFQVKIQFTGFQALTSTIHYLYGCRWCDYFKDLSPKVLLELVILTDKYLLTDFNESISHEIVRSCSKVDQVVEIYEASLHKEYPVRGIQDNNLSLSAISFILVGEFDEKVVKTGRAGIFNQLMKSKMAAEFLDDVNRIVRQKLNR